MPIDRRTTTNIENGANKKSGAPPQVETANISGFQILGIASLEHAMPDDFKIYVHRQTTMLSQVLSTEKNNKIKFSLAIISIKRHVPSRNNTGDN